MLYKNYKLVGVHILTSAFAYYFNFRYNTCLRNKKSVCIGINKITVYLCYSLGGCRVLVENR